MQSKAEVSGCRAVKLPSFFVVGPPRTGTTWLHEVLKKHTTLPSPTKETRFFDQHFHRGVNWYLAHFPSGGDNGLLGEVAPTYFASNTVRQRIRQLVPSAKIVCIFRNPVERVLSLYKVKCAYGMVPWSFEEALLKDPELIESGRYATHFKGWRALFGKDQVLGMVYEDMGRNPQSYVNTITDFIGTPNIRLTSMDLRRAHESERLTHPRNYLLTRAAHRLAEWFKAERMDRVLAAAKRRIFLKAFLSSGRKFEPVSPEVMARIYGLFRSEVEELELILDRELPLWKSRSFEVVGSVLA